MAVLGFTYVEHPEVQSDGTWLVKLSIWSGQNSAFNVSNDTAFTGTTLSTTVNAAIKSFVRAYMTTNWSMSFGLLDDVRLINPVSLL